MLTLQGSQFKDETGRTRLLRGVNLGGSSKVPARPDGATWQQEGFYEHRAVSFVGRPFPLAEADEHYARLRRWGFTFLRFVITWEAIEHAGPGLYDQEYLDYLYAVVKKAGEHGLEVFIDPHQDVWSRFTGGDGAPGWTLEAVGLDLRHLHAAGAALLHQEYGPGMPAMIWPTNYGKLAAATMFTLFFGGRDFAPQTLIEGQPAQDFLQTHYIEAVKQAARRLCDLPNVVGYGTLNEPAAGYIGAPNVTGQAASPLRRGAAPTIFQSMLLGAGLPQRVDFYDLGPVGFVKQRPRLVNPQGVRAWLPGAADIWQQHGVWALAPGGQPELRQPEYFSQVAGRPVNFYRDYFKPFANRFARELRTIAPQALIFVEGIPDNTGLDWGPEDAPNVVHAAHWYDGPTLMLKSFRDWYTVDQRNMRLVVGRGRVRACQADQVADILRQSERKLRGAPTLIGETGIPFDMQRKRAFRSGDFRMQVRALDATLRALERNCASFTLWNYTADNNNAHGDLWNDEDFSLFSRDQATGDGSPDDGGRALQAALRPYPCKIAGEPVEMGFDITTRRFEFTFRHTPGIEAPTELYIPQYQYPQGCTVTVSDGRFELDLAAQTLRYWHSEQFAVHTICLGVEGLS
jgi:hypothetical protein